MSLVESTARGDSRAFEALAAEHATMIDYCVRAWLARAEKSELHQAALVSLWRAARTFREGAGANFATHARRRIRADLRRYVRELASDLAGGKDKRADTRADHYDDPAFEDVGAIDAFAASPASQEAVAFRSEVAVCVRAAVRRLSGRATTIVAARWFTEDEPLSMADTAAALGLRSREHAQQVHGDAVVALARDPSLRALARANGWPIGRKYVDPRHAHVQAKKTPREPDADEVAAMREKRAKGLSPQAIGAEHGLSYQRVLAIVERRAA